MKKVAFSVLAFAIAGVMMAQKPGAARSNAKLDYDDYVRDPIGSLASLDKAKQNIEIAAADPVVGIEMKTIVYKNDIYVALAKDKFYSAKYASTVDFSTVLYDNVVKGIAGDAAKKGKKDIQKVANIVFTELYNSAIDAHNKGQQDVEYGYFSKFMDLKEKLATYSDGKIGDKEISEALGLNVLEAYRLAGYAAAKMGKVDEATKYFKPILESKAATEEQIADIYGVLFDAYKATDKDKAMALLKEGRAKFPKSQPLLIKSIQVALDENRLAEVENDLVSAVENDPKNVSLQFALATVYDGLQAEYYKKGDAVNGDAFYAKAEKYYAMTNVTDPKFVNGYFNLGALYFNSGVVMFKTLNDITDDKAYTKAEKEMMPKITAFYEKAVPLLAKAEELDPKSLDAVRALRDIYIRLNNAEKMDEYTKKYKALSGQ